MTFDFGTMLSGMGGGEAGGGMGGSDIMAKLMGTINDPVQRDLLLNKLAMSGVAPPPAGGMPGMPPAPGPMGVPVPGPEIAGNPVAPAITPPAPNPLAMPPSIPVGPNPLQATVAGLNAPAAYPNTPMPAPGVPDAGNPNLGKLLMGAQSALKSGMSAQGSERPAAAPNPGTPGSYGSTNMAKAPGYLPTSVDAAKAQRVKSLGALLGGR